MPIIANQSQQDDTFLGSGWENKGGISILVDKEAFNKLPVNSNGTVRLFVGRRKQMSAKTNASHYVAIPRERPGGGWVPNKPPEGMPQDPVGHTPDKDLPF